MNVLFISRAYPPVVGGIERQNYEISQSLAKITNTTIIANRRGKRFLPLFAIYALFKIFQLRKRYDVILLGDGVLAFVGPFAKLFSPNPVVCIIHGLDITFQNTIYRLFWLKHFFNKIDKFIAVGNETVALAEERGIRRERVCFIPNGVNVDRRIEDFQKSDLYALLGSTPAGPVLLTLGCLVKRKGVAWFVEEVMTKLDPDVSYVIAGAGPEEAHILQLIAKYRLEKRVLFLGMVSDREKEIMLSTADVFIQPNIRVEHDVEGFGLVVLEAARYGTYVIASELEGLKDAVTSGKNGLLVSPGDSDAYIEQIELLLEDMPRLEVCANEAQRFVLENYSWDKIAELYAQELRDQCAGMK